MDSNLKTECEELRAQLARARVTVVALLAIMYNGDAPDRWDLEGVNGDPLVNDAKRVMDTFSITEEELAAEYQRQYDEWVRGSTDGQ